MLPKGNRFSLVILETAIWDQVLLRIGLPGKNNNYCYYEKEFEIQFS